MPSKAMVHSVRSAKGRCQAIPFQAIHIAHAIRPINPEGKQTHPHEAPPPPPQPRVPFPLAQQHARWLLQAVPSAVPLPHPKLQALPLRLLRVLLLHLGCCCRLHHGLCGRCLRHDDHERGRPGGPGPMPAGPGPWRGPPQGKPLLLWGPRSAGVETHPGFRRVYDHGH